MIYSEILEIGSNIASIATAIVACVGYFLYRREKYQKRLRLEKHLKQEKVEPQNRAARPLKYLSVELGMTDLEIMDVAFKSKCITHQITTNMYNGEPMMLLRYKDKAAN